MKPILILKEKEKKLTTKNQLPKVGELKYLNFKKMKKKFVIPPNYLRLTLFKIPASEVGDGTGIYSINDFSIMKVIFENSWKILI